MNLKIISPALVIFRREIDKYHSVLVSPLWRWQIKPASLPYSSPLEAGFRLCLWKGCLRFQIYRFISPPHGLRKQHLYTLHIDLELKETLDAIQSRPFILQMKKTNFNSDNLNLSEPLRQISKTCTTLYTNCWHLLYLTESGSWVSRNTFVTYFYRVVVRETASQTVKHL